MPCNKQERLGLASCCGCYKIIAILKQPAKRDLPSELHS